MKSYYHNGTAHGDAIEAPYSADVFSALLNATYAPQKNCVVWNTGQNSLRVDSGAGRTVDVQTGTAFIQGIIYTNTAAVNVSVPQNTTIYPRIDAVIVRYIAADNEARIALKNGIPNTAPVPPDIKDNELLLAYLYLAPAFAAVTAIYDKREFAYNSDHAKYFYTDNTMINSEFMAFAVGTNVDPPSYWTETGTALFYSQPKFDQQARGRSVQVVADAAGEGMTTTLLTTEGTAKMFTVAFLLKVTSGICAVTWAGTTINCYPSTETQTFYIRVSATGYQTLSFLSSGGAADFIVGQITLTQGYIPSPFEARHEVLFFTNFGTPVKQEAAQSSGLITLTPTDYGDTLDIYEYVQAYIIQVGVLDTGSAGAGTPNAEVYTNKAKVWVGGITNSAIRYGFAITEPSSSGGITLELVASGANTMTVNVTLLGLIV